VVTFNVWGLPGWINGASGERSERIARTLEELGPEVIMLQEVWTRRCFASLSALAGSDAPMWSWAAARRKGGFLGQNGLLTLSRYPIAHAEFRPFRAARLPDALMHKGALKVTIRLPSGDRVNCWNVHLQSGSSGQIRARQVRELVRWVEEAEDRQVADIVAGDFNFTPGSREFRRITVLGPSVYELAQMQALPTWDGLKDGPDAGRTLDHIFVRMKWPGDKVSAEPARIFAAWRREDRLSDHMGVAAWLSFSGRTARSSATLAFRAASSDSSEATGSVPQ
jgi:endonuclease/exonuclease/phosphatase family metal-dependent hydrolase